MKKEMKIIEKSSEKKEIKSVEEASIKKKEVSPVKKSKPKISQNKSKPLEIFNAKTIKIEAEFDDGETEVEIKTPKEKIEFTLKTTNKKTVLLKISERTGIDVKKLDKIVEFEEDD